MTSNKEEQRLDVSQRWSVWEASLPTLELSEEEKVALTKARSEKGRVMSVEEIMAEATSA